jgi:hypothetical protein
LISSTIKYNSTASSTQLPTITTTTQINNNSFQSIDIILNLDKRYLNQHLLQQNNETTTNYFQNLILKSHLAWSYYYYEHSLKLKFKNILFNYFTDSDYLPKQTNKKQKLFNLNPVDLLNNNNNNTKKLKLNNLFNDLNSKYNQLPSNMKNKHEINAYILPMNYLLDEYDIDGMASQSSLDCDSKQSSLILIKDKYVLDKAITNKFPMFKLALEEANILIDLIAYNLGNTHNSTAILNCSNNNNLQSNEYNWYFQVHSINSNTISGESDVADSTETDSTQANLCLNRLIRLNTNLNCNNSNYISVVKEPTCGNGIIEANEQCDCEQENLQCLNCCNMKTCKFNHFDYQCSHGDCCDLAECKFKSKSSMCRQTANNSTACDWPEYCTGWSAKCPENKYHHNGLECMEKNESGTCWNGVCTSASLECKSLWSDQASNSDQICYNKFNTIGFENGNCGIIEQKRLFKSCDLVDAECGLLQCQSGTEQPLIKTENYFKVTTKLKENSFECKSITNQPSIYVSDGTQCNNKAGVCIQQKCTSLNKIIKFDQDNKCFHAKTKTLCSNNGVCTNLEECQCFDNWSGKYCEQFSQQKSINQFATVQLDMKLNLKTTSLMSIVAGVSIIVLILLFIAFICYRRVQSKNRLKQKKNNQMKKSLSRSLIEFDNDYTVNSEKLNHNTKNNNKSIFSSFKNKKQTHSTSTRANSIVSLTDTNNNISNNSSSGPNDCSISFTKVNHAIQQLNSQPVKSILKKDSNQQDTIMLETSAGSSNQIDSSFKFERQVNRNTLLNAAIGNGHRTSRRSLVFDNKKRASICSLSSSSSSISLSSCSSDSISSSLSKTKQDTVDFPSNNNKQPANNSSFVSNTSSSISSVVIQEPTNKQTSTANDFLKVQDYLNELNILSKQNTFANKTESDSTKRNSKEIIESNESPVKPISLLFNHNNNNNNNNKLIVSETPQRPISLLTTVFSTKQQETLLPSNQMLHLHISKQTTNLNNDETSNLFTNSSETSSGYLSNSTTNLNQQLVFNNNNNNKSNNKFHKLSKESLFETDEYYSITTTTTTTAKSMNKQFRLDSNESNSSSSSSSSSTSSALTTPTIVTTKVYISPNKECSISNGTKVVDKRFSYIIATASSNNLNVS